MTLQTAFQFPPDFRGRRNVEIVRNRKKEINILRIVFIRRQRPDNCDAQNTAH